MRLSGKGVQLMSEIVGVGVGTHTYHINIGPVLCTRVTLNSKSNRLKNNYGFIRELSSFTASVWKRTRPLVRRTDNDVISEHIDLCDLK